MPKPHLPNSNHTHILSGLPLRDALLAQVKAQLQTHRLTPSLHIIQVGNNPASTAYITRKQAACAQVGITSQLHQLPETTAESTLATTIKKLQTSHHPTAIIIQTPLPVGWNTPAALNLVPAAQDADGLSHSSIALRQNQSPTVLLPATPLAVLRLLEHAGVQLAGTPIAVIGKGMVVGAPLRHMLSQAGAHVIGIDKSTANPAQKCQQAQVVVSAAGVPNLVTAAWLTKGAVVIDVGITRQASKLVGDANASSLQNHARILTPVPGGVGPVTVASILTNVADAAFQQANLPRPQWHIPRATIPLSAY